MTLTSPPPAVDAPSSLETDPVFVVHKGGKLETRSRIAELSPKTLAMAYTPGVARVCMAIAAEPELAYRYTCKSNTVAVVTDRTAVLSLGDIGPAASLPVMEGKALLFREFGGVDAVAIALDCTDVDAIVETVVRISPPSEGSTSRTFPHPAASRSRSD
jgi:malate dehydrogenase (oxaloacetate-decarboxylating)